MGMKQLGGDDETRCVLEFGSDQAKLVLEEVGGGGKVDHKTAFGRIAFAVPSKVKVIHQDVYGFVMRTPL